MEQEDRRERELGMACKIRLFLKIKKKGTEGRRDGGRAIRKKWFWNPKKMTTQSTVFLQGKKLYFCRRVCGQTTSS